MTRICAFDRFQPMELPLVVASALAVLLTSVCSPYLWRLQFQSLNAGSQSVCQVDGLEEAGIPHKTNDASPKACDLLLVVDSEASCKHDLLVEHQRPAFTSAIPLTVHLVYTQTVSEHL